MKEIKELKMNVLEFINSCAEDIGKNESEGANITMWNRIQDYMDSPIEQLMYCALYTIARLNWFNMAEPIYIGEKTYLNGLSIYPQYEIGTYRVDFLVVFNQLTYIDEHPRKTEVIVECDSQQFHERTEQERRYEKKRDRFLQTQGYKVFRFTGSEITKNPLSLAVEVISIVTDTPPEDLSITGV
jgi:very-short-patch-repair endonuclease